MSIFWILAGIITVVYVLYYAGMILYDLNHKPKDATASHEETIDISGMVTEAAKSVEETAGGFRVSRDGDAENGWNETNVRPVSGDTDIVKETAEEPGPMLDASGAPITPAQQKINAVTEDMEETDVAMTGEFMEQEMRKAMTAGNPPVPIKKTIVKPAESNEAKTEINHDAEDELENQQTMDRV